MKKLYYLLIILVLFFSEASFALDSKLIVTSDQNINDKWGHTFSNNIPKFNFVESVFKKQYFTILLFLTDYKTNDKEIANIKFDLIIKNPDNVNTFEQKGLEAIHQKIDNPNLVQLSKTNLKVCFEPEDELGIYQILINVYDLNSNKKTSNQCTVELIDFKNQRYFQDDESFENWLTHYYSKPSPEYAIDGYLYYSKSKLNEKENGFIPIFNFFREIFNTNTYLVKYLIDEYSSQSFKSRIYIIYLLRYLEYDSSDFLNSLKGDEKKVYQNILKERFPHPKDEITDPLHLDIQWTEFLSTGKIAPIRKVISALEFSKYEGFIDNFKNTAKTELDKQNALKDAIFQAACWSLESNCKQHSLVGDYCAYLFKNGDLTKNEKLWTGMILSKVYPDRFQMMKNKSGE